MKYFIDDEVEIVHGGYGVASSHLGKRTTITAINGNYDGETDAVQLKDFPNPGYGDWISQRSIKLV